MNEPLKVIVLYPVLIGIVSGIMTRLLGGGQYAATAGWVTGMALSFLVWFPFSLRPFLLRRYRRR